MNSMEQIQSFLSQKRLAMVGVSRQPRDFSRVLFREFRQRGYEVLPVTPCVGELDGQPCFASVREIQPPVSTALLMTAPGVTEAVVRDCAEAGVERIWMFRAGGTGAVSSEAVRFCQSKGIAVIPGECPFMFLARTGCSHRLHAWMRRIAGTYPR